MNIAIIGTRGIPNHYGGFEQFAEFVSAGLVRKGHDVYVYNSHTHPFQEKEFKGVKIIHCKDPEYRIGTVGQFIYDLNCILDARKRNFDIILQLGYTSSSIWSFLFPRKSIVITNMDGLEWKRTKYSTKVRKFLTYAESWAVRYSNYLIADSIGIQKYLKNTYSVSANYIPYGAEMFNTPNVKILTKFQLEIEKYDMLIARLEPENNIELILNGFIKSNVNRCFLVIGNTETKYGQYLTHKYSKYNKINFIGSLYDLEVLNNLRYYSNLYFHGHTVGGTNPSLLEAMGCSCLIAAHNNEFNNSILGNDGIYFNREEDVSQIINDYKKIEHTDKVISNNNKIREIYTWSNIINLYNDLFVECIKKNKLSETTRA